jgi:shikimate dehydrogenase
MIDTTHGVDRYGLVGHPVDHSRSPLLHGLFADQTGENISYELIDAEEHEFEVAVRGFSAAGGKGLNVTVPHKERAFELADQCGTEASVAHAVNTLTFRGRSIIGDNTDGLGFMRDLTRNLGQSVAKKHVLVLGAGGAAKGIVYPLLSAGPASLAIANRTMERAFALRDLFAEEGDISVCSFAELGDVEHRPDLVVNATSAGLHGHELPFPESLFDSETFCYDLSYSLRSTPFVAFARKCGVRNAVQGWGMLVEQAAESFRIWRGVRPDTGPILAKMAR